MLITEEKYIKENCIPLLGVPTLEALPPPSPVEEPVLARLKLSGQSRDLLGQSRVTCSNITDSPILLRSPKSKTIVKT